MTSESNEVSANARDVRPTFPFLVLVVAGAALIAMLYVQRVRVPGPIETTVRICTSLASLLGVPILLTLGFKSWLSGWRSKLPPWRNGLALSSMVLPSLVWVSNPQFGARFFHVDPGMFATLVTANLLTGLLAIALRGKSRLFVVSAVLLLWAGLQSGIYF
jgi:hypothetical protein